MSHASSERHGGGAVLAIYTAAVFISALLLFGVQPMFTRMVLPQLGGSPSVWSVAMVFFQSMLLAGYAYAHWLSLARQSWLPVAVHLGLLVGAGLTLPLSIAKGWGEPPAAGTALWLLALFTVSIGLPFFALAANGPLLQTWFVRSGHRDAKDPYFLYAASNVGSFLALLSYPILLEPTLTLHAQVELWSFGFALLIAVIAACAYLLLRAPPVVETAQATAAVEPKPSWRTIGRWVFISAVPSGLLVAVTVHISTDVAAAPLLWVMPLSLYLLTWVLVFARRPVFSQSLMLALQPFAVAAIVALLLFSTRGKLVTNISAHLLTFFIIAMACHGELARSRPAASHLTAFYVSLSFGGMVGGLFAGLFAPYAFNWVAEYPILAVLAVLCRPMLGARWAGRWFWPVAAVVALALIVPPLSGYRIEGAGMTVALRIAVLTLAALSILLLRDPPKAAVTVALAFALIRLYPTDPASETVRSFFGVNKIYETGHGRFRVLEHGSTMHGAERLLTDDGRPFTGRPEPLTYYHRTSGMTVALDAVRAHKGRPIRAAIIGLGAGSLACWMKPEEHWRYFEIDPTVIAIARDSKRFRFISDCAPDISIVLGDARLTLAKEPDGSYDVIVVDAYSSDAIPVHLATREAMAIYKAKLAPHGVVVMHISNRYLELESVISGIAAANGMTTWRWSNPADLTDIANFTFASEVVISAASAEDLGSMAQSGTWVISPPDLSSRTWTDDYSNIAGAFWRRYWQQRVPKS